MYHGKVIPYFLLALSRFSANIWNKYLGSGKTSIKNVPLGPLCPSLVPWPPAIVTTAYWLFFITFSPSFVYFFLASSDNLYSSTYLMCVIFFSDISGSVFVSA